jgi:hypothetical protein
MEELNKDVNVNTKVAADANEVVPKLKQLMDDNGITTFVPLAKVVGIAPQKLYSKKSKKLGGYNYDSIERLLVKTAEPKTIEMIIEEAAQLAGVRAHKKAEKAEKKAEKAEKKEQKEKIENLVPGMKVEYKTYRVVEGVKENYMVRGTIASISEEGIVFITKEDGDQVELSKEKAGKILKLVADAESEVAAQ